MSYAKHSTEWQRKKLAAGLCESCGKEPLHTKRCCLKCVKRRRELALARKGFRPKVEGGPGRPRKKD